VPDRPWELKLAESECGQAFDEATELVSMLADEMLSELTSDYRHDLATGFVISLVTDEDYRRCITELLQATEYSGSSPPSPGTSLADPS